MTHIDFLTRVFEEHADSDALIWRDESYSYGWLLERLVHWRARLEADGVAPGNVTSLEADFSPEAITLFLALIERGCILVPLTSSVDTKKAEFLDIAQVERRYAIGNDDTAFATTTGKVADSDIYAGLRESGHPGLVLFSSGSTGQSKAAVHDLIPVLKKFAVARRKLTAVTFLLYDHIGGVNTVLYQLSNGGCIVTVANRDPDTVLAAVERHHVQLLPTSPTFVNLVLLSEAYLRHDVSSLETLSYGTEPMPESTLKRFHDLFPKINLLQTYGLSEVGILRSQSKSSDSLWVRIGGEGFETRVVDGALQIKAESAMLGYLNAPSPFTDDGWFETGDLVEVDGEFVRFLGRRSEIINVGGEKVYPAEVESVIQEMDNVAEATVFGESNAIVGQIVCATVTLIVPEDRKQFAGRLKKHCLQSLPNYKVPIKVRTTDAHQHGERFKKMRSPGLG